MTAKCDHCNLRQARVNVGISRDPQKTKNNFRCLSCYQVEQRIAGNEDWRENVLQNFIAEQDLSRRENESPKNLINRCKIYMKNRGYLFG